MIVRCRGRDETGERRQGGCEQQGEVHVKRTKACNFKDNANSIAPCALLHVTLSCRGEIVQMREVASAGDIGALHACGGAVIARRNFSTLEDQQPRTLGRIPHRIRANTTQIWRRSRGSCLVRFRNSSFIRMTMLTIKSRAAHGRAGHVWRRPSTTTQYHRSQGLQVLPRRYMST